VTVRRISASALPSWKKAAERRRSRFPSSSAGGTTRCIVDSQRSFVHRAVRSPRLISSAPGAGATGSHVPSGRRISSPGTGSAHRTVTMP
jgi:hypothetical protein